MTVLAIFLLAEDMPRLFQGFVQRETTQVQRHDGTGLDLALSKKLVELHGGRIWAASEGEGRGSTFTIRLPFAGAEALEAEAAAGSRPERQGNDGPLASLPLVPRSPGLCVHDACPAG